MLTLLLLVAAHAGEPDLSGTYVLAESPEALAQAHASAQSAALEQLPWAMRPFAKGRLAGAITSCKELELSLTERTFRSRCDAKEPYAHDRSSPTANVTGEDGKPYEVRLTVGEESVGLRFAGEEGGQATTYQLQADGSLVVTRAIFSSYLEKDVPWTVRYRRAD